MKIETEIDRANGGKGRISNIRTFINGKLMLHRMIFKDGEQTVYTRDLDSGKMVELRIQKTVGARAPQETDKFNEWNKYLRNQVNASKGIKKVLTVLLFLFSFAANAQKSVTYHVHFPEYVQLASVTQQGDTIHGWHGSGTFKLKMKQGETPLSLIVASETKRTNLTFLPPNGEERVYHIYDFENTILSGK